QGEKLRGGFALTRMQRGDKPQRLLIKKRDEFASEQDVVAQRPESVVSGRSIEDV
ncbi:MAG: hypothetical protein QOE65_2118, partial [Solirubrobacteraceae bacterium]|nr:hypothetical protein [Solirubrobacteraceae bacterium]